MFVPMSIPEFIQRCNAFCEAAKVSQTWLSKRLFADTFRLRDLASGKTDIGVRRLDRAIGDLGVLERERAANADPSTEAA
jgi:hypothetical protein